MAQIVYFSHGGGPLPVLGEPGHRTMVEFLQHLGASLKRPDSIIVFSAHWEEEVVTLQGGAKPQLYYDYSGFPEESYHLNYPSPGNPELVNKIAEILKENEIHSRVDSKRGFDHGHFIPLMLMYPDADIPSFQISLLRSLDPEAHISLGMALSTLLEENVLVIGSGFSFHNLSVFFANNTHDRDLKNNLFQEWLIETCTTSIPFGERKNRLINWESAPNARYCHPREEHLLPLHVCAGLAGTTAEVIFDDHIAGVRSLAFQW
jgi:aromatic ring-opening dioxygenase catalytic subunit (LigB family)